MEKRYYSYIERYRNIVEEQRELIDVLKRSLNTDRLTGLFSETSMNTEGLLLDSRRDRFPPYAVAMIDVDSFKESANDPYGHDIGDEVLKVVASAVKETFRPGDLCCRPSGDEFVVIMPELSLETDVRDLTISIEERLVDNIHQKFVEKLGDYPGLKNIGISVGIATSTEKEKFGGIKKLADQRMYQSKRSKGAGRR